MGRDNLNTVAFQCSRKQKCQNYGVQNNYIDSNAKIKGSTVFHIFCKFENREVSMVQCISTPCMQSYRAASSQDVRLYRSLQLVA